MLRATVTKGRRVMDSCSMLENCRDMEHVLREKDLHTCCFHGNMPRDDISLPMHRRCSEQT